MSEWYDWKWQLRHSIRDIVMFEKVLGIKESIKQELQKVIAYFPLSITPYYASLIDVDDYA